MSVSNFFKVIALDDHPIITDGLRLLLNENKRFRLCAIAHSWQELISKMREEILDIAILDLNIKGENILSKIGLLKEQFPKTKLLIFSSYNTPSLVKKAFSYDINGYLLKDTTQDELLEALEAIMSGKIFIGNRVAVSKTKTIFIQKGETLRDEFETKNDLTDRELEVIKLISRGLDSQGIANHLFISLHTVQSHRKNIMRKLDLHSAKEIVRFAFQNGLV
jgi:DNA-binding NarL/FixJ family response regulator